jgi:ABC-type branched-subunit amino acid transport system substrate-binding protein
VDSPPPMSAGAEQGRNRLVKWISIAWNLLSKWIVLPLVGALVGVMLIGRITDRFIGPKSYKVVIVGNFREGGLVAQQVLKGIGDVDKLLGKIDDVNVEVAQSDDFGDPSNAHLKAVELASRSDTLMVVGHFSSTQTKAALPAYLRSAKPQIPVILTTETNPTLLPPASEGMYDPVFRLSPTDDQQAETAAKFGIDQGATAFWVVADVANPVYSDYLAGRFSEQVLKSSKNVVLWTNNLSFPPIDVIRTLKVDWVFFAGGWRDALILVRQLKATPEGRKIRVLLSDGSVDKRLIEQGGTDVEGVYLIHPMRAESYNSANGYSEYGTNASELTKQLLNSAAERFGDLASRNSGFGYSIRRILGLHRITDARNAVVQVMNDSTDTVSFNLTGRDQCVFQKKDGLCATAQFHVWQVKQQRFVDFLDRRQRE